MIKEYFEQGVWYSYVHTWDGKAYLNGKELKNNKMKTENLLERVKSICEKEGIKVVIESEDQRLISVRKVDEWEGVEFAMYNSSSDHSFTAGKTYRMLDGKTIDSEHAFIDNEWEPNGWYHENREYFNPSTEQAYKEQLIQEAEERFGEIKEGDEFEKPDTKTETVMKNIGFSYWKVNDILTFGGVIIYEKGKWSKKIERPTVRYLGWEHGYGKGFQFSFDFKEQGRDMNHIGNHLAECLKDYLTKKQNA